METPVKRLVEVERSQIGVHDWLYLIEDTKTGKEYLCAYNSDGGTCICPLQESSEEKE